MANQIEDVIYSRLQATSAVTDLVSTRVYPIRRPADASLPLIVFDRVGEFSFIVVILRRSLPPFPPFLTGARALASRSTISAPCVTA